MRVTRLGWLFALVGLALLAAACSSTDSQPVPPLTEEASTSTTQATAEQPLESLSVTFRSTPVDVTSFDHLPGRGSLVEGAWYDSTDEYMIVDLGGGNYHYCDVHSSVWRSFGEAESLGTYFNASVKGRFDCREGGVPGEPIDNESTAVTTPSTTSTTLDPIIDDIFNRTFDGELADRARIAYWMMLMNDYGGYDAPVEVVDDAAWISQLFDGVAESDTSCENWGKAVDLHLSSEDTYSIRPTGWTEDDAYYELVASILAFSAGQGLAASDTAFRVLEECHDPTSASEAVNRLLTEVVPLNYDDQKTVFKDLIKQAFPDEQDGEGYLSGTTYLSREPIFVDQHAMQVETCDEFHDVLGFGPLEENEWRMPPVAVTVAATFAASKGPGRILLNYCGI